ncbi:WD repeat-containing protein 18 [Thrips palmi]|uniref:WD repeat-containing protein 18 n=1 Tax=Thrips palmi TaxID=161013 RepID=A0A6P8ZZK1_THRPL|nr:WD repeat-containing protein 18 [Thrips palmi]
MTDSVEVAITSEASGQLWSVSVWDTVTGSQLMTYKGGGVCGNHAVALVGSDYIIGAEKTKPLLHVWPVNSSEPSHDLRTVCPGLIGALAVSPNGKFIVAGIGEKIHVWQVEAGRLMGVAARHFQPITCIRFFEDGSHFVSAGEDGMVCVWSLKYLTATDNGHLEAIHSFSDHYLAVKDVYVGSGGSRSRIVSVSLDGSCRVYDLSSGKLLLSLVVDGENLTSVVADVLESSLFLGCNSGDILHVSLCDKPRQLQCHLTEEEKESVFKGHTKTVTALSSSQDASTLLSASADETVRLWHIESKQSLRTIQHKGQVTNAFLTFLPSQIFAEKMKPNIVMHRLQRVNDSAHSSELSVEISVLNELVFTPMFETEGYSISQVDLSKDPSATSEETSYHKKQMNLLQKKNLELFKLASEKIFNGVCDSRKTESVPSLIDINKCLQLVASKSLDISQSVHMNSEDSPIVRNPESEGKSRKAKKKKRARIVHDISD